HLKKRTAAAPTCGPALLIVIKGFAQSIQQMTVLYFAPFRPAQVGPQRRSRLRIQQRHAGVPLRDRIFSERVQSRRPRVLSVGQRSNMGPAAQRKHQVGLLAALGDFKMSPFVQFQHRRVLQLRESRLIYKEDAMRAGHGLRQICRLSRQSQHAQTQENHEQKTHLRGAIVLPHSALPALAVLSRTFVLFREAHFFPTPSRKLFPGFCYGRSSKLAAELSQGTVKVQLSAFSESRSCVLSLSGRPCLSW